jgi:shikimate kinase
MDAQETAELIEQSGHDNKHQNRSALTISILAMVLAIASLGGSNAMKEATQENILAANAYAFYQAKNIRQTTYKLAASDLELQLAREPNMNATAKAMFEKKIEDYKKTAERYESEPETKEGKKELMAKARKLEADRDEIRKSGPWLTFAGSAFQISIVLLTASILAVSMSLFWGSIMVGALATLLMSQGLWLWLPITL